MKVPEIAGFLSHQLKLFGILCAVAGLALAMSWTLRIGLADMYFHRNTLANTEKSIRLTPSQAEYQEDLARYLGDLDGRLANQALQHAVTLDPYDAEAWIQLGIRYETENRLSDASRCLRQAASVDHTFLPAWSLANFYFRQNDPAQFWFWIRQASLVVPEDASPLFRLCWHFTDDADEIDKQLDLNRPDMQAQYITFLLSEDRMAAVEPVTLRLAARNRSQDTALLLNTSELLIGQHQGTAALNIWNLLAEQHRIPFHAIYPRSEPTVTNADFIRSPTSLGFDWHLPNVPGISAAQETGLGGLQLEFSSDQPESVELLTQVLAVQPNTSYNFMFDYSTSGIAPGTGLMWRVVDLQTGSVLASTDSLSADKGAVGHLSFAMPAGSSFVRIALLYRRALGTTRIEGSFVLHKTGLATVDSRKTKQ